MQNFSQTAIQQATRIFAAGLLSCMAVAAWAVPETDTGHLTVNATIANQCAVGNATLALGAITMVNANGTMAALSGGSTVNVPWACTNGTAATLGFDAGANSTGANRRMMSTTAGASNQFLEYQLNIGTSGGTAIDTTAIALSGADGTNQTFTVWGGPVNSAANRAALPANDYTDDVLLTISFSL